MIVCYSCKEFVQVLSRVKANVFMRLAKVAYSIYVLKKCLRNAQLSLIVLLSRLRLRSPSNNAPANIKSRDSNFTEVTEINPLGCKVRGKRPGSPHSCRNAPSSVK